MKLTQVDLFSGIGGFALGGRMAGLNLIGLCESFPYCQSVLSERFPGVPIVTEVQDVVEKPPKAWVGCTVLTGGSPFDANELVDRGDGGDAQSLWPLFLAAVRSLRPLWVVHETFPRFLRTTREHPASDLRAHDYHGTWILLPSGPFDCPGRKDRLFLVATRGSNTGLPRDGAPGADRIQRSRWQAPFPGLSRVDERLPEGLDTHAVRLQALGNATLPQSAAFLLGLIASTELDWNHS